MTDTPRAELSGALLLDWPDDAPITDSVLEVALWKSCLECDGDVIVRYLGQREVTEMWTVRGTPEMLTVAPAAPTTSVFTTYTAHQGDCPRR